MGRKSASGGVTEHNGKIRVDIWYRGKRLRPVLDAEWNERNRRTALRMVGEIREKIRHGVFDPADYFPEYSGLETLTLPSFPTTFRDYAKVWLRSLGQKAPATRDDYQKALDRVWLDELGERPIRAIRYSELVTLIGNLTIGGKTLNNYLIPLRGVFELARRDGAIQTNRAAAIENASVQKPAPDPFTLPEVEAILESFARWDDAQVVNYFAAAFFAGFRPSEQIALRWTDVDFEQRTVRVQRAVVRGQAKASTKTYLVRDVELSDRAWAAIESQRAHTQLAGKEIFGNPATAAPWVDIQSQRRIWQRCLKRLGLRYREPYQARHTFATLALMAGANPSYIARQLGHTNANMLFRVYSKWIDGADKSREREKLNVGFGHDLATELIAEANKFAQSRSYLAVERVCCEPVSRSHSRKQGRMQGISRPLCGGKGCRFMNLRSARAHKRCLQVGPDAEQGIIREKHRSSYVSRSARWPGLARPAHDGVQLPLDVSLQSSCGKEIGGAIILTLVRQGVAGSCRVSDKNALLGVFVGLDGGSATALDNLGDTDEAFSTIRHAARCAKLQHHRRAPSR